MKAITKLIFVLLMATVAMQAVAAPRKEYSEKELYMAQFVKEFKQAYTLPMTAGDGVVLTDLSCEGNGIYFHFSLKKKELYDGNTHEEAKALGSFLAKLLPLSTRLDVYQHRVYLGTKIFDDKGKKLLRASEDYVTYILRGANPDDQLQAEANKRAGETVENIASDLRKLLPIKLDEKIIIHSITTTKSRNIVFHVSTPSSFQVENVLVFPLYDLTKNLMRMKLVGGYSEESLALMAYYNISFVWKYDYLHSPNEVSLTATELLLCPPTKLEMLGNIYIEESTYFFIDKFKEKYGFNNMQFDGRKLTANYFVMSQYKNKTEEELREKVVEEFNMECSTLCPNLFEFAALGGEIEITLLNSNNKKPMGKTLHLTPQEILKYAPK
ncbi:MAG: hypothetical protein MJZ74_08695 [Muribaculaceae bacterium]|nr:hypothetical protein [Muribaculaceae bacterium]